MTEIPEKECREVKSKLKIQKIDQPTYVILLVVHNRRDENEIVRLNCRQLLPISGYPFNTKIVPVGGYVYDSSSDTYIVNCIDYLPLGQLPFAYKVVMDEVGHWSSFIPVPSSVIRQSLTNDKRADLERFRIDYNEGEVNFQYIQFTSIA